MTSIDYEHFFCVRGLDADDVEPEIRANVLYRRCGDDTVGAFFGYTGGGCFECGYFWIDGQDRLRVFEDDWSELPQALHAALESLDFERQSFEDWSDDDVIGRPSERGLALLEQAPSLRDANDRTYASSKFDHHLLDRLSSAWPLLLGLV